MAGRKDVEELVRNVRKQGFRVEESKSRDAWLVYGPPEGGMIVTMHKTPSASSIKYYKSDLRKLGWNG